MALSLYDKMLIWVRTLPDKQYAQEMLSRGSREVLEQLPQDCLWPFYSEVTDPDGTTGVNVIDKRIISVHKNGIKARQIDYSTLEQWVVDEDGDDPLYYLFGTNLYILPDGGTAVVATPPAVDIDDTAIANTPAAFADLVVLRASIQAIVHLMADLRNDVGTEVTMPAAPTALSAPSFTGWTPVTPTSITNADIDFTGITPPSVPTLTNGPLSLTNFTAAYNENDIELAALELQHQQVLLSEWKVELEEDMMQFTAEAEAYRALVQKAIRQAELNLQEAIAAAQHTDDIAIKNQAARLENETASWTALARKHESEWAAYSANVQALVREIEINVSATGQKLRMFQYDLNRIAEEYRSAFETYKRNTIRHAPINIIYRDF